MPSLRPGAGLALLCALGACVVERPEGPPYLFPDEVNLGEMPLGAMRQFDIAVVNDTRRDLSFHFRVEPADAGFHLACTGTTLPCAEQGSPELRVAARDLVLFPVRLIPTVEGDLDATVHASGLSVRVRAQVRADAPCGTERCTDLPQSACRVPACRSVWITPYPPPEDPEEPEPPHWADRCVDVPRGAGLPCDDGLPCTGEDQCTEWGGCVGTSTCEPAPPDACLDDQVLADHGTVTCTPAGCAYSTTEVTCTNGCAQGACR